MIANLDINVVTKEISDTIIRGADAAIKKFKPSTKKQRKPWWNDDCRVAYRMQRRAWNTFKRYPTSQNFILYKRSKAFFRKTQRRSQKDSWIKYVNSINSNLTSKILWDRVKRVSGVYPKRQIPILEYNNRIFSSPKDIANTLASSLSFISSSENSSKSFKKIKIEAEKKHIDFTTNINFPYNSDFTYFELKKALSLVHKSTPGPDNISYIIIKNLSEKSLKNLLIFYNRIFKEHTFPQAWQHAVVIPILKPGKDPKSPLSYRPIALTNCLCKVLEKMVNARLMYVLEKDNAFHPFQSGFRRNRSSVDNLLALETEIRNAFVQNKHLVSIFFDIEKAYDRTWRHGILVDIFDRSLRGDLPIFIQNFLSKRYFNVKIGSTLSDLFIQEEGVPQSTI
ncbi:rna-directed dna polymerase from mobile element jockey-like protein [Lasius niger]|uniref:Rna-directed dna polymerase from mobile element jockey-like protein n=1 Tax=Lasius niger TaxID=67767 RepID=A0A0J7K0B8_LASNI|nr:rna-directed dna polymerase from mobile element jockey-like protein [Lasius niger]